MDYVVLSGLRWDGGALKANMAPAFYRADRRPNLAVKVRREQLLDPLCESLLPMRLVWCFEEGKQLEAITATKLEPLV